MYCMYEHSACCHSQCVKYSSLVSLPMQTLHDSLLATVIITMATRGCHQTIHIYIGLKKIFSTVMVVFLMRAGQMTSTIEEPNRRESTHDCQYLN